MLCAFVDYDVICVQKVLLTKVFVRRINSMLNPQVNITQWCPNEPMHFGTNKRKKGLNYLQALHRFFGLYVLGQ